MKKSLFIFLALTAFFSAKAQVSTVKTLTIEAAKKIAAEARRYALQVNAPHGGPAIAIVDHGGNLLYLERPETTFAGAAMVAYGKAHTAAMFGQPTQNMENAIKGGRTPLLSAGFVMMEGGVPILHEGAVIGAIGISGAASSAQDVEIGTAASKLSLN